MADVPTTAWSETTPAGSDNIALGDNRIRELKTQIREVIDVDHDFPSSGQAADVGQHKKVTLQEQADLGTGAEGVPILGAQTVDGKAELVFTDEDDNDVQMSSGGSMGSSTTDILGNDCDLDGTLTADDISIDTNDTAIKSKDAAGTGTVDLIKANTNDEIAMAGGFILPEDTLPVTDANEGAVYTKNDGTQTELFFGEESAGDEVQLTKGGGVFAGRYSGASVYNSNSPTSYTDLNLSATIGSIRAIVLLWVENNGGGDGNYRFRTNGEAKNSTYTGGAVYSGAGCSNATINDGEGAYIVVPTDTGGIVEWICDSALSTSIDLIGYLRIQ